MKKALMLSLVLLLSSCTHFMQGDPSEWTGKEAYTKHGFHYEKGRHLATNYIKGMYVPPATKVKVMEASTDKVKLRVDGNTVEIINIEKYTYKTMSEILDRMLSKVDFKPAVSEKYKVNLKTGQPALGMRKAEVILCIGYPPTYATESLESAVWQYWYSKLDRKNFVFLGDKLDSIRN